MRGARFVCWDDLVASPAVFVLKPGQEIVREDPPQIVGPGRVRRFAYVRTGGDDLRLVRIEKLPDGTPIQVIVLFELNEPVTV